MNIELVLFLLRLVSGLLLLALMGGIFLTLWRDYRHVVESAEANRRIYGQLVALHEVNGNYIVTGANYPLLKLTSLGRSPTNSITIEDTFASSDHAFVALRGGQWWLEDRHSRNGTTLNEVRITQPVIITDGEIIGIGRNRFRLELEQE
jgi:hypothetical protein